MNNEFYAYIYLDPRRRGKYSFKEYEFNFEPFYVGKGKGNRCYFHLQKISRTCNPLKSNKINKIINNGLNPIILKIHSDLNEKEAYIKENELIKLIGRIDLKTGTLTNLNDGGLGGNSNPSDDLKYRYGCGTRGKTYE